MTDLITHEQIVAPKIIEINGVKMEVDLRTAKTVESYKVGDSVKILLKEYSDKYKSHIGVIIGFDAFEKLPTIIIAYLVISYNETELKFAYLNRESKDIEICAVNEHDISAEKSSIIEMFDGQTAKAQAKVDELKSKKEYFLTHFSKHFEQSID